jgi:anti-anti-sigma factor
MLEINSTVQNTNVPVTVINIKGDVDASNYEVFQTQTEKIISDGAKYVILDLQGVDYMSSAGLRVIHGLFNKLRQIHQDANDEELRNKMKSGAYKSPYIKVVNLSSSLKELFELSGFETYIEVYDDVEKAIQSF